MRKIFSRLKFILRFWKTLPFVKDFFLTAEVATYKKLLSGFLIVTYAIFPHDLIPDFLYGVGIVDDVVIITLMIERMVKWAPQSLKSKYNLPEN